MKRLILAALVAFFTLSASASVNTTSNDNKQTATCCTDCKCKDCPKSCKDCKCTGNDKKSCKCDKSKCNKKCKGKCDKKDKKQCCKKDGKCKKDAKK